MAFDIAVAEKLFGTLSVTASSLVILTLIIFPELRNLRYLELATYIAICDLLSSLVS